MIIYQCASSEKLHYLPYSGFLHTMLIFAHIEYLLFLLDDDDDDESFLEMCLYDSVAHLRLAVNCPERMPGGAREL